MKLHYFILILFCRLFIIDNSAIARAPAVEPVTGLSIEEYNTTTPTKESGFDFKVKPTVKKYKIKTSNTVPKANRSIAANRAPERSMDSLYDKSSSDYVFLIILGILPFVIWFGIMTTIDSIEEKYRVGKNIR